MSYIMIPAMENKTWNDILESEKTLEVSYWEQIFTSTLVILLGVIGITGNTMIVLAVAFSRKLQTSTNVFIASLAVTDLLTSFFSIFHGIGTLGKGAWPIPEAEWLCVLTAFVVYVGTGTSCYHLGIIAVNRLILIIKPFLFRKIFTRMTIILLIIFSWIVPSGALVIILQNGIGRLGYDKVDLTCSVLETSKNLELFTFIITLVCFPIPLFAILSSYIWIYIYVKRYFRTRKKNILAETTFRLARIRTADPAICASQNNTTFVKTINGDQQTSQSVLGINTHQSKDRSADAREKASREEIKITKNLFLVVCSFFICFLPYFILIFIPTSAHLLFYTRVLTLGNSSINFAIYARRHPVFRVVLKHMITCSYGDIPQPSKFLHAIFSRKR